QAVTNLSIRKVAERFQRSNETISRHDIIHLMDNYWLGFRTAYMQLPSPDILSEHIKNNPKFFPFFKDALGAIDGTHIPCFPPAAERAHYRDK
ncbi:hypothetical protein SCLCIDRAFT_51422, partial [Scleroderma citrinum Foug A]